MYICFQKGVAQRVRSMQHIPAYHKVDNASNGHVLASQRETPYARKVGIPIPGSVSIMTLTMMPIFQARSQG